MIVTAADYNFREYVETSRYQAKKLGYPMRIFDLGGLGFGEKFEVSKTNKRHNGNWKIKSPYKPNLIEHVLSSGVNFVVYLDADAILVKSIEEVLGKYDIGLTVRRNIEPNQQIIHNEYTGQINAGVLFFYNTMATKQFVTKWKQLTNQNNCDQVVLNRMLTPVNLEKNTIVKHQDLEIKCLDTDTYNFYYFPENYESAKILHFKTGSRNYFEKYKLENHIFL